MQMIYLGATRKIKDIDLKNNRVYTEKPEAVIEKLKNAGLTLAEKLFVPVEDFLDAEIELKNPASPIGAACKQLLNFK